MEDILSTEYWGEEIPPSKVTNPVVFNFKPKQFIRVAPEHLREWEELFLQHVGLRPVPKAGALPWAGSPGGSISGSNNDWDD